MITLIKKSDNDVINPEGFFKKIEEGKYKDITSDSFYSICKFGYHWIVFIQHDDKEYSDTFVFQIRGYHSKQDAINAIDSGSLEEWLNEKYTYTSMLNNLFKERI